MRFFILFMPLIALFSCGNRDQAPQTSAIMDVVSQPLPPNPDTVNVRISDLNCWVEQNKFFVSGLCDNRAGLWQRIWLRMEPLDSKGQPLSVNGQPSATIRTFSDAVPPLGRTSFFAEWPLSSFSSQPDSCRVTGAGAMKMMPGPILINADQSGVRMLVPDPDDPKKTIEKAWQASVIVENPLEMLAYHPRVEILIYGKDKRLWFAQILNPEDPAMKQIIATQTEGPMQPHERRRIGTNIFYDKLPKALCDSLIGRVDFLPFEARE